MEKIEKLVSALTKVGLSEYKAVKLTSGGMGLMVKHDYIGLYPTVEAYEKHYAACKVAKRFGLSAEKRGHVTATLIYPIV